MAEHRYCEVWQRQSWRQSWSQTQREADWGQAIDSRETHGRAQQSTAQLTIAIQYSAVRESSDSGQRSALLGNGREAL
jgi:hypothetical protein